ncbi:MAG: site-2 protease family protein, partial [bacterium]
MDAALRIVALVLLVGLAILIHEFGHFLAARLAGIKVLQFSIGFPPRLFGFKRKGIEYLVQAIPLGGYVRMAGEDWSESRAPRPHDLMAKPARVRILVYAAGVTMNVVLAFVLFTGILMSGLAIPSFPSVLGELERASPAAAAGLQAGDRLERVAGRAVRTFDEVYEALEA